MKYKLFTAGCIILVLLLNQKNVQSQSLNHNYNVIPQPAVLEPGAGKFTLGKNTLITGNSGSVFDAAAIELKRIGEKCSGKVKNEGKIIFKLGEASMPPSGKRREVNLKDFYRQFIHDSVLQIKQKVNETYI